MDPIQHITKEYNLFVLEDAAQAHGALYKGHHPGSRGIAACFSFYPGKNLGAYGEAGAVVTNDAELADKIRLIRDHGSSVKYHHSVVGCNGRMDGIQAAVLSVKLKHLDQWNDSRRRNANLYRLSLQNVDNITLPVAAPYSHHVYHIYPLRSKNRDELMDYLKLNGIHSAIHYPVPIHLQEAYSYLNLGPGSFPVAEKISEELISLPMFAELTCEQVEQVCNCIAEFHSIVRDPLSETVLYNEVADKAVVGA